MVEEFSTRGNCHQFVAAAIKAVQLKAVARDHYWKNLNILFTSVEISNVFETQRQ